MLDYLDISLARIGSVLTDLNNQISAIVSINHLFLIVLYSQYIHVNVV